MGAVAHDRCPACGDSRLAEFGDCGPTVELKNAVPGGPLYRVANKVRNSRLVRCLRCHLVTRIPQLTETELAELYVNLPGEYWSYDASKVGSWKAARSFLARRFSEQDAIRVLDVGAFDGSFLNSLSTSWEKAAIEPATVAVEKLRAAHIPRIAAFVEDLEPGQYDSEFDVVTLFDVFEHLPKPLETLRRVVALLKPGGRLLLSTGNVDHWTWRAVGAAHWYMHSAQHVCVGSPGFFRYAADELQVDLEWMTTHSHQIASGSERCSQTVETMHSWAKRSGRTWMAAMIQRLPSFGYLVHKTSAPFANGLKDHLFVVLKRRTASVISSSSKESDSCRN